MATAARAVFQNNELLRHLDSAGIDRVARLAARRSYDHGATIFSEGDTADAIYGVISGQVQISARTSTTEEIFLDAYGSGRIFGLISGIDGLLRCATARAAPAAEVFVICRDQFLRLIAGEPLLSLGLLAVFCQRQRVVTRMIVGEYAQKDIPARLAHRVLELTGVDPTGKSCLDITQAELAKFVFVSRQVVNHYLSEWHSRGWVSTSPRRLRVTDREALLAVATSADSAL
ncbi:MAG: Crp/Fnr family transcriptional regulator [Gammaproteobacteria bacterium]